jgi:hypothetical protein
MGAQLYSRGLVHPRSQPVGSGATGAAHIIRGSSCLGRRRAWADFRATTRDKMNIVVDIDGLHPPDASWLGVRRLPSIGTMPAY